MEATQENPQLGTGWIEFSERHARAASSDFARSVVQYFSSTLLAEARGNISHRDLLKKFLDCFADNFEYEYRRRSVQQGNSKVSRLCPSARHRKKRPKVGLSRRKIPRRESHGWTRREKREKNMGVVSARFSLVYECFSAQFSPLPHLSGPFPDAHATQP